MSLYETCFGQIHQFLILLSQVSETQRNPHHVALGEVVALVKVIVDYKILSVFKRWRNVLKFLSIVRIRQNVIRMNAV